jgi:ketosteroid isomerase-like protein
MTDQRLTTIDALFTLLNEQRYPDLDRLLADDVVFDVAYYPVGGLGDNPTVGREAVTSMFTDVVAKLFDPFEFAVVETYLGAEPDVVIVEYTSHGTARSTGRDYSNRYVGVFRIRDGKVQLWREYHNPEQMTAAFGSASGS